MRTLLLLAVALVVLAVTPAAEAAARVKACAYATPPGLAPASACASTPTLPVTNPLYCGVHVANLFGLGYVTVVACTV